MLTDATDLDDFWDELLSLIGDGKVIPIVGPAAVTFGKDDQPLYPWLAARLAESLAVPPGLLPPEPSLHDVVSAHRLAGGAPNKPYLRLKRLLEDPSIGPGPALGRLASIEAFRLFLAATFDPLLAAAVQAARPGGAEVLAYSSREACDLPARLPKLTRPHVFHLLGRVSASPEYVVWEEDAMEFALSLQSHLPVMPCLAGTLKDASFLVLGLNFTHWLVRFFLRITKQARLSSLQSHEVLAGCLPPADPATPHRPAQILFFGNQHPDLHLLPVAPAAFIAELERRWRLEHPLPPGGGGTSSDLPPPAREIRRGEIFLSYTRADEAAAVALRDALVRRGCKVWYDRERLASGVRYDPDLQQAVEEQCCAFLSVISPVTESRTEGYFRLERDWAARRAKMFAQGDPFYFPVVIDPAVHPPFRGEPEGISKYHVEPAPGGQATEAFAERLLALQRERAAHLF